MTFALGVLTGIGVACVGIAIAVWLALHPTVRLFTPRVKRP